MSDIIFNIIQYVGLFTLLRGLLALRWNDELCNIAKKESGPSRWYLNLSPFSLVFDVRFWTTIQFERHFKKNFKD